MVDGGGGNRLRSRPTPTWRSAGKEVISLSIHRTGLWHIAQHEGGQGLAEYALILALISIISIVALLFLGTQISTTLSIIGNTL